MSADLYTAPHVMVDIETLDTSETNSIVMSVGACWNYITRTPLGFKVEERPTFYLELCVETQAMCDRTKSDSTLNWWRDQISKGARWPGLGASSVQEFCVEFSRYLLSIPEEYYIWAKGPQFDIGNITSLYKLTRIPVPWKYSRVLDYRTISKLGLTVPQVTTPTHHALEDAQAQLEDLISALRVAESI